jgi:EAL domain-containing protein (putative c-di-GMP-specific phosphodiesterase class I)
MHEMRMQHVELEQDLHEALRDGGQLGLHYQPVVHVEDRRVLAIEALARWEHPRLGPIPPDRFIAIAETTGLMVALGKKLMQIAVEQAVAWEAERPGSCPLLNINVSPVQFFGSDVVGDLSELVRRHGLQPHQFCLEITESVFAAAPAVQALERARALGFHVAMDDFGIGYSTLSQLPRLPLTSLKLDRSFIVNATESAGDAAILLAIVQLAHALNLVVVAEGVETRAQFDLVATVGCDAVQGYLVARPMRPDVLQAWLSDLPDEPSPP